MTEHPDYVFCGTILHSAIPFHKLKATSCHAASKGKCYDKFRTRAAFRAFGNIFRFLISYISREFKLQHQK